MKYKIAPSFDDFGVGYSVFDKNNNRLSSVFDSVEECQEFISDMQKSEVINSISELLWSISIDDLEGMKTQIEKDLKDI